MYEDADDLLGKLERLTPDDERSLQQAALAWAREHTTRAVAARFLGTLRYNVS